MSKKKAFALRINEEMLKAIEKWASDEFRITNGQIEWILMQYLKEHNREPKKTDKKFYINGETNNLYTEGGPINYSDIAAKKLTLVDSAIVKIPANSVNFIVYENTLVTNSFKKSSSQMQAQYTQQQHTKMCYQTKK